MVYDGVLKAVRCRRAVCWQFPGAKRDLSFLYMLHHYHLCEERVSSPADRDERICLPCAFCYSYRRTKLPSALDTLESSCSNRLVPVTASCRCLQAFACRVRLSVCGANFAAHVMSSDVEGMPWPASGVRNVFPGKSVCDVTMTSAEAVGSVPLCLRNAVLFSFFFSFLPFLVHVIRVALKAV